MPIYLNQYMHFNWTEIGSLFTIMLLPFVLFEIPAGWISDKHLGEQEIMVAGFLISSCAVLVIPFLPASFLPWAIVLFISRVGASLIEVTTESYFFKKVDNRRTDVISLFRVSRPLALVIAPVIATVAFGFIPFQYIFIVVGSIMIVGTHYSLALKDTK